LDLVWNLIRRYVKNISKFEGKDITQCDDYTRVKELIDWVIENWKICKDFTSRNKVFELQNQQDRMSSGSQMIALHEAISGNEKSQAIATLLFFNKKNCKLTPCTKIQFYSDEDQINLVNEFSAGNEETTVVPPLMLNYGRIWAKIQTGTKALLSKHQQE
jgi:hypothetical protein